MNFCEHKMSAGVHLLTLLSPNLDRDLAWVITHDMYSAGIPLKDFSTRYHEFPPSEDMHQRLIDLEDAEDFSVDLTEEEIQKLFYREENTLEFAYVDREGNFGISKTFPDDPEMVEAVQLGPNGLVEFARLFLFEKRLDFYGNIRSKGCPQCEEVEGFEGPKSHTIQVGSPEFERLTLYQYGNTADADPIRLRWFKSGDRYRLDYTWANFSSIHYRDLQRMGAFAHNGIELPFKIGEYEVTCKGNTVFMEKV